MNFAKVKSVAVVGLTPYLVDVEVNIESKALPKFEIVGLPGKAVEEAKERVKDLVKEFSEIPKLQLDEMKEEQIKWLFIEPLIEALGWEKKSIEKEARVLKGRADYILKSGNKEAIVIEAKKTNVPLMEEEGRQAVSYAYHRKIKF